jgi:hypothetical protein
MATRNLGQVAGLWVGTSAPANTSLIWWDSTPAIQLHKVYDAASSTWVALKSDAISSITYSELETIASGDGFTVGTWYKITDRGNTLALAITETKLQYVDQNGNSVIDDVGTSVTYLINSDNLYIDDIQGVFDTTTKTVTFTFTEQTVPDADDYVLAKRSIGGVWGFIKIKLQKLISTATNNSITWNNGLYMNFTQNLQNKYDANGGVVSKQAFDQTVGELNSAISSVGGNMNNVINQAKQYTDQKTTDTEIYGKRLTQNPTQGAASDIVQGDTLSGIVSKVQRWFNTLRWASGVKIDSNFVPETTAKNIDNSDTVLTAMQKLQYYVGGQTDAIKVGEQYIPIQTGTIQRGDSVSKALGVLNRRLDEQQLQKTREYDIIVKDADDLNYLPTAISDYISQTGIVKPNVLIRKGNYTITFTAETLVWCDLTGKECKIEFEPGVRIKCNPYTTGSGNHGTVFLQDYSLSSAFPLIQFIGNSAQIQNLNNEYVIRAFEGCSGIDNIDLFGNTQFYRCVNIFHCYTSIYNNGYYVGFFQCNNVWFSTGHFHVYAVAVSRIFRCCGYVSSSTHLLGRIAPFMCRLKLASGVTDSNFVNILGNPYATDSDILSDSRGKLKGVEVIDSNNFVTVPNVLNIDFTDSRNGGNICGDDAF